MGEHQGKGRGASQVAIRKGLQRYTETPFPLDRRYSRSAKSCRVHVPICADGAQPHTKLSKRGIWLTIHICKHEQASLRLVSDQLISTRRVWFHDGACNCHEVVVCV